MHRAVLRRHRTATRLALLLPDVAIDSSGEAAGTSACPSDVSEWCSSTARATAPSFSDSPTSARDSSTPAVSLSARMRAMTVMGLPLALPSAELVRVPINVLLAQPDTLEQCQGGRFDTGAQNDAWGGGYEDRCDLTFVFYSASGSLDVSVGLVIDG